MLSRGMPKLDGDYASDVDRSRGFIGPLWQGRFRAQLIVLANVTGIICLTLAIANDPLIIGLYGVFRLIASYGLLRMKTYGLILERVGDRKKHFAFDSTECEIPSLALLSHAR